MRSLVHIFYIYLLATVLLCFSCIEASACTCTGPRSQGGKNFQPCSIYGTYDVIFIGHVEKLEVVKKGDQPSHLTAHFKVDKPVRGVETENLEVQTGLHTAMCGYPLKEGESYFAYLRRGKDGTLTEFLCGATIPLANAEKDLEYLRAVENGEKGARIFGDVSQLVQESSKSERKYVFMGDIPITLKSVKSADTMKPIFLEKEYRTKTDSDGFYSFYGIPPGAYLVEASTPSHLRPVYVRSQYDFPTYVVVDADRKRCGRMSFGVTALGSIHGKVVNSDGTLPPQQHIQLLSDDENSQRPFSNTPVWISPKDGSFMFDLVAPGRYTLAVNPNNCPGSQKSPQYGRSFFFNVSDPARADFFDLKLSQEKELGIFRLQPTLKERFFGGIVLSTEGLPVTGASVRLLSGDTRCSPSGDLGETKTDENGRFILKGHDGFSYRLRAGIENMRSSSGWLQSEIMALPEGADKIENLKLFLRNEW